METQIDINNVLKLNDVLNTFANKTRFLITQILLKTDKPISISEIHRRLEKLGYKISYKNTYIDVKILQRKKIVKVRKAKDWRKLIILTEEGKIILEEILNLCNYLNKTKVI